MPVAYLWHPRKDRKVCVIAMRTIFRRVHPLADLCYHMVLRYHQLEREIDVENISPFNIPLRFPSALRLFHSFLLFFALSQYDAVDISIYVGMRVAEPALCSRSFFTLHATRERAYALFAPTLSEKPYSAVPIHLRWFFRFFPRSHILCHSRCLPCTRADCIFF